MSRPNDEEGLEITIPMASTLSHAAYATTFDGRFLLKGFCSALVPTALTATSVVWHYLLNENKERISYTNALEQCAKVAGTIDFADLSGLRHFVGWTPEAELLTGTWTSEHRAVSRHLDLSTVHTSIR